MIQNSVRAVTNFFIQTLPNAQRPGGIQARVRIWFNPGREEALYIVPGIFGVVFWVFPSMLSAISVVREKEQGTAIQVYASDLSSTEWLLGKGLAYWLVAIAEALVVMVVSFSLFHIRLQTSPLPLIVGTGTYLAAAVSFGLFVGARGAIKMPLSKARRSSVFSPHFYCLVLFIASKIFPFRSLLLLALFLLATTFCSPVMPLCGEWLGEYLVCADHC